MTPKPFNKNFTLTPHSIDEQLKKVREAIVRQYADTLPPDMTDEDADALLETLKDKWHRPEGEK
jgi:hypothetical protein